MTPNIQNVVTLKSPPLAAGSATRRPAKRLFFLVLTILLMAMVVKGFWPSYYGPMLGSTGAGRAWIMHVHGAIYSGWMLLQLLQVTLIVRGNVAAHRRVGTWGIGYGALVLVVGLIVSFAAPLTHIRAGEWTVDRAAGFMILPLFDMVLFGGFFGAAIYYKARPEIHKRLILAATVAVVFAAVARMRIAPPALFYLVWISPMLIAMAFDLWLRKRIHPVYFICVGVMTVAFLRVLIMESAGWVKIGRALLAPFL
jgi:hypothetical protein